MATDLWPQAGPEVPGGGPNLSPSGMPLWRLWRDINSKLACYRDPILYGITLLNFLGEVGIIGLWVGHRRAIGWLWMGPWRVILGKTSVLLGYPPRAGHGLGGRPISGPGGVFDMLTPLDAPRRTEPWYYQPIFFFFGPAGPNPIRNTLP